MKYTIVILIDFIGHPSLGDQYTNDRRYSELLKFATSKNLDKDNIVFVTNQRPGHELPNMRNIYSHKLFEILSMLYVADYKVIYTHPEESISNIINKIKDNKDLKWDIKEYNTQVIIGGCNLGGCVINAKPMSAVFWQLKGYKTTIHLPLCAEYEQPGTNQVEKIYRSIEQLFHFTKEYKAFGIEYCTDFHRLKMTYKGA